MIPFIIGAAAGALGTYAASKIISKDEDFYTTKDVAKLLEISEYTIRKKIRDGEIKAEVIPGKSGYRISASDLEEYKNNRRRQPKIDDSQTVGNFGKILEAILTNPNVASFSAEFFKNAIEGRQLDLKGLQLRLQKLELDKDDSTEFKKNKISLEIAINDLKAEIQAYQTAQIAVRDLKKFEEEKIIPK